jgi:hypothetical protein
MTGTYLKDLAERVAATFAGAFIGLLYLVPVDEWDASTLKKAAIAGGIAALSLVKGLLARFVGRTDSASVAPGV